MSERDGYSDDVTEGTEPGEQALSSAERAALDDASAERGQDGTTLADLEDGDGAPASGGGVDSDPAALQDEAERANRLPGAQD